MSLQIIILALMSAVATTYAICAGVLYNGGWILPGGDRHPITRLQRGSALCMVIGAIAMGAMVVAEAITDTPTARWTLLIDWVCDLMLASLPLGTVALRQERYGRKHFLLVGLPLLVQLALILIWGNSHPLVLTYVGYGMYTWLMVLYLVTMVLLRRWDRSLKGGFVSSKRPHTDDIGPGSGCKPHLPEPVYQPKRGNFLVAGLTHNFRSPYNARYTTIGSSVSLCDATPIK